MSQLGTRKPDYDYFRSCCDSVDEDEIKVGKVNVRTKQAFKDSCDINKIIQKAAVHGAKSHLQQFPPEAYGEFENYDLLTAYQRLNRAQEIFDALPSEVRSEFSNDALAFAGFASDPANNARLAELLPAIAKPGAYFPNPVKRGASGSGAATPVQDPATPTSGETPSAEPTTPAEPATGS